MGCGGSKKMRDEMREADPEGLKKDLTDRYKILLQEKQGIMPLIGFIIINIINININIMIYY